ncbi:MAG: 1-deoxy-D-xylulose-5-phosphate reductoisomerase [Oscillospiraceae bacterium]|nr:1-deoxy-D-xylulose-5-phosphate reductoisomerase [Oscillospiraceae bacterium]
MRRLSILGSTGSIGTQALDVALRHRDRFAVTALAAHSNAPLLFEQVRRLRPAMAGLVIEPPEIPADLRFCDWVFGPECLVAAARAPVDAVLVSVVGFAGLHGVLAALDARHAVLLANKEPLVAAGALVTQAARRAGKALLPVDSEHSAIFQCLQGAGENRPRRLLLTASGGPFRTWAPADIAKATVTQALAHPNWVMGNKITIDSATMMNKALEIIEAHWLFDVAPQQIEVLVHPQSVVHSAVEFADGAVIAQLGTPDMRLPILYAMAYPDRLSTGGAYLDLAALGGLSFETPDEAKFPALSLAYGALAAGGNAPAVLNGANEVAVDAFLQGRMPFGGIAALVAETLARVPQAPTDSLAAVVEADGQARRQAQALLPVG